MGDRYYDDQEPMRDDVDAWQGATVLEFGAEWCGYCIGARPSIASALRRHAGVRHVRIADGKGRPLGRSFGVKLWPTLVFLRDGREMARAIRPTDERAVLDGLAAIAS
jgi:thioredoxin 1